MNRETFLDELFSLEPAELAEGLPPRLQEVVDQDPSLAAEVRALKAMDLVLPKMGRVDLEESFFLRQRKAVMAEVRPLRPTSLLEVEAWSAPGGSLVALLGIIGCYSFAGIEGGILGNLEMVEALSTGPDPLNSFLVVYACLLVVALYVFHLDSRPVRVSAGATSGA